MAWKPLPLLSERNNTSLVTARALKRTGFLETLRYDATTTTAASSSITHTFSHFWLERQSLVTHWWWDKVALAKSVSKLLLAASASKARLIVVTCILCLLLGYFTFAFRNGPRKGHYSSQIQINAGGQNGATIRVAIIDIRHAALGQIWHLPENHK